MNTTHNTRITTAASRARMVSVYRRVHTALAHRFVATSGDAGMSTVEYSTVPF